jgi:hypothetical protein
MSIAIASLIISFLVACAVVYREFLHEWLFRPNLQVEFSLNEPISRETLLINNKKGFWLRLRITNNGRSAAQRCEGVLAEVRRPNGTLDERYDPLILRWAIAPINKGLEPLDIASGRQVNLNIFTTIENERSAPFATYPDPRGVPLSLEPGDYWFRIIIYGDNFKPVERGYAVHWDGKDYKKIAMQEMKEHPNDAKAWPY